MASSKTAWRVPYLSIVAASIPFKITHGERDVAITFQ